MTGSRRGKPGKVWLVGFGPGDPELVTLKGHRILLGADVLYHDDLVPAECLQAYPGRKHAVGKRVHNGGAAAQAAIHQLLLGAAQEGLSVARVKAGDPLVFGRGGEELAFLKAHGVEVDVVPGVSAAQAAAATLGCSLTQRGVSQRLEIRTGRAYSGLAPARGTVVYYMGAARLGAIAAELLAEGYPAATPVALVENASRPDERTRVTTLAALPLQTARAPLTIIAGDVAGFAAVRVL